jgi:hypothetical protein
MILKLFYLVADPNELDALTLTEVPDWKGFALSRMDRRAFFDKFQESHAVQYFYEPFLQAFDPELEKNRTFGTRRRNQLFHGFTSNRSRSPYGAVGLVFDTFLVQQCGYRVAPVGNCPYAFLLWRAGGEQSRGSIVAGRMLLSLPRKASISVLSERPTTAAQSNSPPLCSFSVNQQPARPQNLSRGRVRTLRRGWRRGTKI